MKEPIITFRDVGKSFDDHCVLESMNLDVESGETLTIIGGSGSGKSVTLKLVLGILQPDSGSVLFKGSTVGRMSARQLVVMRQQVGMLFQGAALFDSLDVYENVAYPIRHHFDYSEEKIADIVAEKLELVGLSGVERMWPADLSGGMKKRVGLARAIATNPSVILYDEPTTGLDPTNAHRINKLIIELQKKIGVTSIVVTHDMDSAFMISDRLAMLYNRQISFTGTPAEARSHGNSIVMDFIEGKLESE